MNMTTVYIYGHYAFLDARALRFFEGVETDEAMEVEVSADAKCLYRVTGGPGVDLITEDLQAAFAELRAGGSEFFELTQFP
jgi:hypothetical protein